MTVYTQQIGRGLRLHPHKEKCVIIDLIVNYRNVDIKLGLSDTQSNEGKPRNQPTLSGYCEIVLDVKVIDLLIENDQKATTKKREAVPRLHELKREIGRRPTNLELHLKGATDSPQYRQEFNSYFGFLKRAEELNEREIEIFDRYENWLVEVEKTGMAKSYKMDVLLAMIKRGQLDWFEPISLKDAAPFFHHYLMKKEHRKRIDFSDKGAKNLWDYNEKGVRKLISTTPMTKWSGSSKGLISYENDPFQLNLDVIIELKDILFHWTKEYCKYRLHFHFES